MNSKAVIEGLLFISGEEGLSLEKICDIAEIDKSKANSILKELFEDYNNDERGIQIEYLGNKFKLTTKPEHKEFYKKLIIEEKNSPLSQSSLETLAIIAYNGPITRVDIDEIRGVNSSYVIRKLLLKDLIEEVGKSEQAGRPKLYNVTNSFLDYFGLGNTKDLPKIEFEKNTIDNETDLFKSKYNEKRD